MSNTTTALLVKLLMTFVAAWLTLGFMDGNPFIWVATVAVIGTALNYILGDLVVLPNLGNVIASIGDGVMAALVAYIIVLFTVNFNTIWGILIGFAIIVVVVKFFFHMCLQCDDKVAPKER
ncbi:DUF2512 family protein [Clostridium formicaceticum]|nr:DUF2512 family protein [Clostridium formicaceticum]AOY78181.1 hypothetical protein BJL90_00895 [Clostridium formicaceticum]